MLGLSANTRMAKTKNGRARFNSTPLYATVFLMTLLATYALFMKQWKPDSMRQRDIFARDSDEVCDDVHHARDQCAFVRAHCGDDEPGLVSYLTFYYCTLGKVKPVAFIILTLWLGLLFSTIGIAASDFFSVNLSTIASVLGLPESLAGVTFLAFGNGSPDVFSTFAAMNSNSGGMAIGELIGAAGFITAVVAGSMALVREFKVSRKSFVRDIVFFIISVSFTMVFLTDGHMHVWECVSMIAFYVFYVCFVVGWHWLSSRRRKRRNKEAASRGHFSGPSIHAADEVEPFHDDADDEDDRRVGQRRGSGDPPDINALEAGPRIGIDESSQDDDDEEDQKRHIASEMTSSMRVNRPRGRRSNTSTITPIRPSLVGALEFRSVLSSLQKSRNMRMAPLIRGYSDNNPHFEALVRSSTDLSGFEPYTDDQSTTQQSLARDRALSSGDAPRNLHNVTMQRPPTIEADLPRNESGQLPGATAQGYSAGRPSVPSKQSHDASRPRSVAQRAVGDIGRERPSSSVSVTRGGHLAPPDIHQRMPVQSTELVAEEADSKKVKATPALSLQIPNPILRPNQASSPSLSPFPGFYDSPMSDEQRSPGLWRQRSHSMLSPLAETPDHIPGLDPPDSSRPWQWWPYKVLPSPHLLWRTMFPTLQGWRGKSIWDKAFSLFSLPTVFLLVITLPVVEAQGDPDDSESDDAMQPIHTLGDLGASIPAVAIESNASIEPETEWQEYRRRARSTRSRSSSASPLILSAGAAPGLEGHQGLPDLLLPGSHTQIGQPLTASVPGSEVTTDDEIPWNRWLLALQMFMGPLFTVFVIWAKYMDQPLKVLVEMVLYTLLASSILLAALLLSTSPTTKPKYHFIFCFLGFIIAIAWISTIAEEVVGVLKAVGVILGMSEAILGLTIFAVGNSVGDLVADITVARLGYPVMALYVLFFFPKYLLFKNSC